MQPTIPVQVFFILALLVAIGLMLTRPREQAPRVALVVAVGLGGYSLWGVVSSFGVQAVPVLAWVAGLATALTVGFRWLAPQGVTFIAERGRVRVPGSWLPLALMLGIFSVRFALGTAAGLGSPVPGQSVAAAAAALALGVLSGGFAARSLAVLRAVRSGGAAA